MKTRRFQNVAVLMGGTSSEHPISLHSGSTICAGLEAAGYNVRPVVLLEDHLPDLPGVEAVLLHCMARLVKTAASSSSSRPVGCPIRVRTVAPAVWRSTSC